VGINAIASFGSCSLPDLVVLALALLTIWCAVKSVVEPLNRRILSLPDYVSKYRPILGSEVSMRSGYTVGRKKYVTIVTKRISEQLRKVLGPESVQDADGNIIQETPLPIWDEISPRALETAIAEITNSTVTALWRYGAAMKRECYRETKRIWVNV
jgi:hypothetical protein